MEGRQEGILDDTQELTTENMPENQPGDQPEAELMGQPEKTPENWHTSSIRNLQDRSYPQPSQQVIRPESGKLP